MFQGDTEELGGTAIGYQNASRAVDADYAGGHGGQHRGRPLPGGLQVGSTRADVLFHAFEGPEHRFKLQGRHPLGLRQRQPLADGDGQAPEVCHRQ
ncbi:MAG: hypothetical protein IH926_11300 [Proteobacteria bacterium]|nr:hypothetical protein [Pseudomonadota bacterium]